MLKGLDHPRIVKFYACLENKPYIDLVLEFVGGVSDKNILRNKAIILINLKHSD